MARSSAVAGAFGNAREDILTARRRDDRMVADARRAERDMYATAQPQRPRRQVPTTREEFVAILGKHVAESANRYNWSATVRRMVVAYVHALTDEDGTGLAPMGLRGKPLQTVQQKFAMNILLNKPRDVAFPGTSQDWFDAAHNSAARYRESLRSSR